MFFHDVTKFQVLTNIEVGDRMFLGMQGFDFAQILVKFTKILIKFTQVSEICPKTFARGCGRISSSYGTVNKYNKRFSLDYVELLFLTVDFFKLLIKLILDIAQASEC